MDDILAKKYEIKTQRIGKGMARNGVAKKQEGHVLSRVVRRTDDGWELEADLRHAELIIEQLGLIDGNAVSTPGTAALTPTADDDDDEEGAELLNPTDSTAYRAIAARCNYLQPDRPDIQLAVKETCRMMSKPTLRS